MARIVRVVVPGLPHHITQRGNRREPVFVCIEGPMVVETRAPRRVPGNRHSIVSGKRGPSAGAAPLIIAISCIKGSPNTLSGRLDRLSRFRSILGEARSGADRS